MNNKKKYILTSVVIIVVISIIVIILIKNNNHNISENSTTQESTIDTVENNEFDDLKNSVGNGHNKDVVDVIQDTDENGNRTYTYITNNGSSTTVTIRKKTDKDDVGSSIDDSSDIVIIDDDKEDGDDKDNPKPEDLGTAYEVFMNMDASEQSAFYKSFDNPDAFYDWLDEAEAEYNKLHPTIIVGEDEIIDVGSKE